MLETWDGVKPRDNFVAINDLPSVSPELPTDRATLAGFFLT